MAERRSWRSGSKRRGLLALLPALEALDEGVVPGEELVGEPDGDRDPDDEPTVPGFGRTEARPSRTR